MNALRSTRVATVVLLLLAGACAWSVPASPGRNFARRAPLESTETQPTSARVDSDVEAIYRNRCGRCHAPFEPTHLQAGEWPFYVAKYAPRAGLFGAERERVTRWLMANAR